jgi:hypothetical protein
MHHHQDICTLPFHKQLSMQNTKIISPFRSLRFESTMLRLFSYVHLLNRTNNLIHQAACWLNARLASIPITRRSLLFRFCYNLANLKLKHSIYLYSLFFLRSHVSSANLEIPLSAFCWAGWHAKWRDIVFQNSRFWKIAPGRWDTPWGVAFLWSREIRYNIERFTS